MHHSRSNFKLYEKRKQPPINGCPFCDPSEIDYRLIEQTDHAYVIPNKTFYDFWENYKVLDHLMVVPRRHVSKLNDLPDDELLEVSRLLAKYEAEGYSVYARASTNPSRSVGHQHTHLIKVDTKTPKLSVYVRRPYLRISV